MKRASRDKRLKEAYALAYDMIKNYTEDYTMENLIAIKSARLAFYMDCNTSYQDYLNEFSEQIREGSHNTYLRSWIGYMVEQHNASAIDILKMIIRNNLKNA
jgi:hypothetical protein